MKTVKLLTILFLALVWAAPVAWSGTISQIIVLGDSLSDVGNAYLGSLGTYPLSPPYYNGRFSNGNIWVESLATKLGLPALQSSLAGGTDYAFGGAETGAGMSWKNTPNIDNQLGMYLSQHTPTDSELFVFWAGANDFLAGLNSGQVSSASVSADNLRNDIATLYGAGARQFLVANMPPLGQTPLFRTTGLETLADGWSQQFNTALSDDLDQLQSNPGLAIYRRVNCY